MLPQGWLQAHFLEMAPKEANWFASGGHVPRPHASQAPHLVILPGLCISAALLGVNLLGDALRDWLDPKMRG